MKLPLFALCLMTISSVTPAIATPSGPAAGAIGSYMRSTKIPCYNQTGESKCLISSMDQGTKVFYSKSGMPSEMAVAFVTYQYDTTGNAMDQMAIVFRKDGERWVAVGRADNTVGTSPRNVSFQPNEITYTGTIVGQNDSRVNPTGSKSFRLIVGTNNVTFGGKGSAGTSMSNEIRNHR